MKLIIIRIIQYSVIHEWLHCNWWQRPFAGVSCTRGGGQYVNLQEESIKACSCSVKSNNWCKREEVNSSNIYCPLSMATFTPQVLELNSDLLFRSNFFVRLFTLSFKCGPNLIPVWTGHGAELTRMRKLTIAKDYNWSSLWLRLLKVHQSWLLICVCATGTLVIVSSAPHTKQINEKFHLYSFLNESLARQIYQSKLNMSLMICLILAKFPKGEPSFLSDSSSSIAPAQYYIIVLLL